MQGRSVDNRCYFACDHKEGEAFCGAAFYSSYAVFTPAVKQVHEAGWTTEDLGGAKYRHWCPRHAPPMS